MSALPWSRTASGLRLTVRLTPRGGRDSLGGLRTDDQGCAQLLARVSSPPVDGAANAALVKLVARALHIPKSAVTIATGETSRIKTLELTGDPASMEAALKALLHA